MVRASPAPHARQAGVALPISIPTPLALQRRPLPTSPGPAASPLPAPLAHDLSRLWVHAPGDLRRPQPGANDANGANGEACGPGRDTARDAAPRPAPAAALVEPDFHALRQPDAGTDGGTAADAGTAPTFPTYAQITANATVSTAMDDAWTATKAAATRTSRREQGFWIKYDSASSGYTCSPTFTGPSIGPDETGAADPGTKPADSGTTYTVGLFHTHTPMTYRTGGTRDVGPSSADTRFHTSNNVVGVVYDYVESPAGSGSIPAGHPLNSAATRYSSGPTQRT